MFSIAIELSELVAKRALKGFDFRLVFAIAGLLKFFQRIPSALQKLPSLRGILRVHRRVPPRHGQGIVNIPRVRIGRQPDRRGEILFRFGVLFPLVAHKTAPQVRRQLELVKRQPQRLGIMFLGQF